MTQYAKFIDENSIKYPPKKLVTPNLVAFNFNKNIPLLIQEGYKEVIEDEQPEVEEGYYNRPIYEDTDDAILVHWVATEIVEEEE